MSDRYAWWTDPAGGRHFGRVFPKAAKPAKADAAVEAPVEVASVYVEPEPVAVVRDDKPAPKKRAPAKKKSDG